jgi:hypothetical protein
MSKPQSIIKDAILAIVIAVAIVVTVDFLRDLLLPNAPGAQTELGDPDPPNPGH